MNFKRIICIGSLIFSLLIPAFAQETSTSENMNNETVSEDENQALKDFFENEEEKEKKGGLPNFFEASRFILGLTPGIYINPDSNELNSAPSAPVYPWYIGFIYPDNTFIALEPTLSFFTMYNLWYDGTAYPAEIENRTTTTLSFLLNIPVVFALNIKGTKLEVYPGIAMLMRFGIRAGGVSGSDSGYSGSADEDVALINQWYWSNARFLYLSAGVNAIFENISHVKIGPVLNIYMPVGTIFSGESVQGMIVSAGLKLSF